MNSLLKPTVLLSLIDNHQYPDILMFNLFVGMKIVTNPGYSALLGLVIFAFGIISTLITQCIIAKCRQHRRAKRDKLQDKIITKLMSPMSYPEYTPYPVHRSTLPTPVFDRSTYHSNVVLPSVSKSKFESLDF